MSRVQHPPDAEAPRKYGAYQMEVYTNGLLKNILPTVTTDPNKLEEQAKKALGARSYNYVAGGAGERATMDANRLAFRQWKVKEEHADMCPVLFWHRGCAPNAIADVGTRQMIPRMLRPTTYRDLQVELFGERYESPVLVAPVGVQTIFHQDKELGVAEIAAEIGVPYILSTASSSSIEDVAKASGDGHRWFQLYWPQDDEITISLLHRAKNNGFKVLVVTLDTWALSWRPWDLDNAYIPFSSGIGNQTGFSDPAFRAKFKASTGKEVDDDIFGASRAWAADVFSGAAHTWDQLELLKKHWDGPIVLKGIQHVEDAKKALEVGVQGIVVSNHGGRQLDGAIGSLEVLPEIVDAVGDKMTILFDSGIRTGVDVIKALCLGAKAVLVGRPFVYGLAIGGKKGAKQALQGILADLDMSMGLAGIRTVQDCDRTMIRRVQYGGDMHSSM